MNFKTRLANLEKWLGPRCRTTKELHFTVQYATSRACSQNWAKVLVLLVEAAHASLRTIDVCFQMRWEMPYMQLFVPAASVLAFSRAVSRCQSLAHLSIVFLEKHSLHALDLTALPPSLQRLQLCFDPGWNFEGGFDYSGAGASGGKALDLTALRGLPHLARVGLGPHLPLACSVPAGLSRLTELHIETRKGLVFEEGLALPGLRKLVLLPRGAETPAQLPALQALPGLTELRVNDRVLLPASLTAWRLLRTFSQCAKGEEALAGVPALPDTLAALHVCGRLQAFPGQALAMGGLVSLRLEDNCFAALPEAVTVLSKLQSLTLGFPHDPEVFGFNDLRVLDVAALGDLSAFPCMGYMYFYRCRLRSTMHLGARRHARLRCVYFAFAEPCQGVSAEAVLALHRQLKADQREGVVRSCGGRVEDWNTLTDWYGYLSL